MRLLVTGGAGYIGSVVAATLLAARHEVVVLDDLSTGHADAVPPGATFVHGDIRNEAWLLGAGFDAVLHFAAKSLVGESVARPDLYWANNLGGTLALLDAMRETGTDRIVFSSTAAVYGEPASVPIEESALTLPTSPYGASKLAVDTALTEQARMHGIGAVSLRYFNVAGAHSDAARAGSVSGTPPRPIWSPTCCGRPWPDPGRSASSERTTRRRTAPASGTTFTSPTWRRRTPWRWRPARPASTRSTTWAAAPATRTFEVLTACREVTGRDIPVKMADRRPGDPAVLIASSERISTELGWHPGRGLREMVTDAWTFLRER